MSVVVENIIRTAEVVVGHTRFIANSRASKEALKSANLLKNLHVNALILGEKSVGKRTLASHITQAPIVNAKNQEELHEKIKKHDILIIEDFHLLSQPLSIKEEIEKHKTRIIATAPSLNESIKDMFFSLFILLPPLIKRLEDVEELAKLFFKEACEVFGFDGKYVLKNRDLKEHLSLNATSLKRFVYGYCLVKSIGDDEFVEFTKEFLYDRLGSGDEYKTLISFFDVSIIKAGFAKYGSQLAMSENFGINRNTLRKKINENKRYFEELK